MNMVSEKRRFKSHALGSLAQRALIASLCLLVIPLFLHSIFLYRDEYAGTLADVRENLVLAAKAQKAILEERVSIQWQILDAIRGPELALQSRLHIEEVPTPQGASDHFVTINVSESALLVGRKKSETSAYVMATSFTALFSQLTAFEKASYPFSLAFVDQNTQALAGEMQETSLSITLPVEGADFFLHLSVSERAIERLHKEWYLFHFLALLFFIGVIGGFIVWRITRRIGKPLRQLCEVMERVGGGAVHIRYLPDRMGFEINELGKQFNDTLDQLIEHSQEAERQRISRERLAEELKIGHDIQGNLLPQHFPEMKGLDISAGCLPALEVGGDFYDLFSLENGNLFIAIADTAGKGISACLYALGLRSMLRALAASGAPLSEIVLRANALFLRDAEHAGMFVTFSLGIYHPDARSLEFCNQGHPPAYLIRENQCIDLWTPGIAIGAVELDMVHSKKQILKPGDLLFFYTDGVIESHDPNNQLFGAQRLKDFLLRVSTRSAAQAASQLLEEIELFNQGTPQHDDMTWLVIRIQD